MHRDFEYAGRCMAEATRFLASNPFFFNRLAVAVDAGDQARINQLINIISGVSGLPKESISIAGAPGKPKVLRFTHTGASSSGQPVVVDFSYTLEASEHA
jgi:hypothetical protein